MKPEIRITLELKEIEEHEEMLGWQTYAGQILRWILSNENTEFPFSKKEVKQK